MNSKTPGSGRTDEREQIKTEGGAIVKRGLGVGLPEQPVQCQATGVWDSLHALCSISWVTLFLAGCLQTSSPGSPSAQSVLKLAVTTSTRDSGLLDVLVPIFEKQSGSRVDLIAVGTGAALKLGAAGDVDVVLVHAREAEDAFMTAGHGVRRENLMYNMFEILGPPEDPAGIRGMEPTAALATIATSREPFVSRGDNSGTHKREQQLWGDADRRPQWAGYMESGQGMGATLTMADQMDAYVLTDRGTYLRFKEQLSRVPLVTSATSLRNNYSIIVVDPQKNSSIKHQLAQAFVDFMISTETQQLIHDYTVDGEQLFYPSRPVKEN